ncbi:MAG: hypothetical protein QW199_00500 [Candidatus Pacearchaeota archaeon]
MKPKKINVHYFDSKSERMYYVLGAFYGCCTISESKRLTFRSRHYELVEIVKKELESEYEIVADSRGKSSYFFSLDYNEHCSPLYHKLNELGLKPKKSERKFPKIEESYLSHFVRGFFDARANPHFYKNKFCITLTFNHKFLSSLKNIFEQEGVSFKLHKDYFTLQKYGGAIYDNVSKIRAFLYEGNSENLLYLKEKKELYDRAIYYGLNLKEKRKKEKTFKVGLTD